MVNWGDDVDIQLQPKSENSVSSRLKLTILEGKSGGDMEENSPENPKNIYPKVMFLEKPTNKFILKHKSFVIASYQAEFND